MTTSSRTSSNKTALRASLKKEDDSLADRLVAADAPIEATNHSDASKPDLPTSAAVAAPPSAPARRAAAPRPAVAAKAPAAKQPATARKAAVEAPAAELAAPPKATASSKVAATGPQPKTRAAKSAGAVEMLEKVAKQKRDKLVSYTVKLLKSEEAAIEALRDELSRVAGWAATKSDILRAGVQVFAEQKLEQMQALLGSLAAPVDGKKAKKGKKKKKR
ncbi:MAG: hypothetical protein AW10_01523 [Candidatus Accumulibacter appositus]|uniref:Uncharacterized protein n=1 Tax=Candidatus Accumulibacter appositus TaxID=1454003 RepID=A0A011PVP9_9PROT|nr:hypothetical protein [Accumulibacter sp.]EXI80910.1 MAG: hypothetical protein AW10_01523 [Candidatus Accumulibacter appositus]HRF03834.1 hypothetical protein [Accumulibacter sp.]